MQENNILSEISDDIKTVILERFGSPLLFSFTISWIIINYQVVFILFSKSKIDHRLHLLKLYFDSNNWIFYHSHVWAGPLLATIIYIFVYPYINRVVLGFHIDRKIDEIADRARKEKRATFTYADIEKLNSRHEREIKRYKSDLDHLSAIDDQQVKNIAELNDKISELTNKIAELQSISVSGGNSNSVNLESQSTSLDKIENLLAEINDQTGVTLVKDDLTILYAIAEEEDKGVYSVDEGPFFSYLNLGTSKGRLSMSALSKAGLIRSLRTFDSTYRYTITDEGRNFAFRYANALTQSSSDEASH